MGYVTKGSGSAVLMLYGFGCAFCCAQNDSCACRECYLYVIFSLLSSQMLNNKLGKRGLLKFYAYICAHFRGANEFYPNLQSFRRFSCYVWPDGLRWWMSGGELDGSRARNR